MALISTILNFFFPLTCNLVKKGISEAANFQKSIETKLRGDQGTIRKSLSHRQNPAKNASVIHGRSTQVEQ
jgi:hypothetical protein